MYPEVFRTIFFVWSISISFFGVSSLLVCLFTFIVPSASITMIVLLEASPDIYPSFLLQNPQPTSLALCKTTAVHIYVCILAFT